MPLGIKFLHTPKPRGYRHVNIYYDPEREARQESENRVNKELGLDDETEFRTSIKRGSFRRMRKMADGGAEPDSDVRLQARRANIRFAIIAAILLLLGLLLWIM